MLLNLNKCRVHKGLLNRLLNIKSRCFSNIGNTGGMVIRDKLEENGVSDVWLYTGGAVMPLIDAFYESNINYYINTHEQSLGHAATAYARITGRPGICIVTSGPGLTNIITPITDANNDNVPLIVLSGQVPKHSMGTQAFQECPSVDITSPITKWSYCVDDVNELPDVIDEAFRVSMCGRPGPVHIDLPKCITQSIYNESLNLHNTFYPPSYSRPLKKYDNQEDTSIIYELTETDIRKLKILINNAQKPVIIAGKGCNNSELLTTFAITANIPVTTTIHGMGLFDENHELSLQFLGMHGNVAANYAVQHADLIINIGSRFDDRTTGNVNKYAPVANEAFRKGNGGIIHVNLSEPELNNNVKSHYNYCSDSTTFLETILPMVKYQERPKWIEQINNWKTTYPFDMNKPLNGKLNTQMVIKSIDKWLSNYDDAYIITSGVGNHQMMASQFIKWKHPKSFISSGSLGVMGVGLPYAIGCQVAEPERLVIDIDGDGSFNQTLSELKTVINYNLPIKIAIMNDNELSMVKAWEYLFFDGKYTATNLGINPDYGKLADSYGIDTICCDNIDELDDTIDLFLSHPGAILADFRVQSDLCLPLVKPGNALDDMFLFQAENDFNTKGMELPS